MAGLLGKWKVSLGELEKALEDNPSLRGMLFGYVAEIKLREILQSVPETTYLGKDDDHDRKAKGDCLVQYKSKILRIESKSLQSATVKSLGDGQGYIGKAQVDASDRREVEFENKQKLSTTLLKRGEFDVLAVNCFAFREEWDFVYALNSDLPTSTYKKYTEYERSQLIASLIEIRWPPVFPFTTDIETVLSRL